MRLLICGSRTWTNKDAILKAVKEEREHGLIEVVIDGAALGADSLGHAVAKELKIPTLRFPADWKTHGNSAGPIRNQQMLDEGHPTDVWCFTAEEEMSPGTKDMFHRAVLADLNVRHYWMELQCSIV